MLLHRLAYGRALGQRLPKHGQEAFLVGRRDTRIRPCCHAPNDGEQRGELDWSRIQFPQGLQQLIVVIHSHSFPPVEERGPQTQPGHSVTAASR